MSTPLFPGEFSRFAGSFSTDGSRLVFIEQHPRTGWDIWRGTLGPGGQARALINSPSAESNPALSPDGRWLTYQSDESGRGPEIYVVRVPEGTDRNQVSESGGSEPRWAPHGDELYRCNGRDVVAVSVRAGTSFVMGSRQTLFGVDDSILASAGFQNGSYNVMPDGKGFVFVDMSKRTALGRELVIVQNWFEELKALMPAIKQPRSPRPAPPVCECVRRKSSRAHASDHV